MDKKEYEEVLKEAEALEKLEREDILAHSLADYDFDTLLGIVSEINSYSGAFEELEFYDIQDLYDMLSCKDFIEAVVYGDVYNTLDPVMFDSLGHLRSVANDDLVKEYYDSVEEIAEYVIDNLNSAGEVDINLFYEDDKELLKSWKLADE